MGIDHSNPYIHSTTVLCDIPSAKAISVEVCGMCWFGNWIGDFGTGLGGTSSDALTLSEAILPSVSSPSVLSLSFCVCSCW